MKELILSCFKYKAVISDDGRHCKVIDPDGVVRGDNLTTQQALDLRYELYEKEIDERNHRADRNRGTRQLTFNFKIQTMSIYKEIKVRNKAFRLASYFDSLGFDCAVWFLHKERRIDVDVYLPKDTKINWSAILHDYPHSIYESSDEENLLCYEIRLFL